MNSWTREIKQPGQPNKTEIGDIMDDFYRGVLGDGQARVSMTVGFSLQYGETKVSATVSVACNQDETTINAVGEKVFFKAHELATEGLDTICRTMEEKA